MSEIGDETDVVGISVANGSAVYRPFGEGSAQGIFHATNR
jgi:hypothetical protein